MELRVTYDREADAAFVYLRDIGAGAAARQVEAVPGKVILSFDAEDHLLGIEVLSASSLLPDEIWQHAEQLV